MEIELKPDPEAKKKLKQIEDEILLIAQQAQEREDKALEEIEERYVTYDN